MQVFLFEQITSENTSGQQWVSKMVSKSQFWAENWAKSWPFSVKKSGQLSLNSFVVSVLMSWLGLWSLSYTLFSVGHCLVFGLCLITIKTNTKTKIRLMPGLSPRWMDTKTKFETMNLNGPLPRPMLIWGPRLRLESKTIIYPRTRSGAKLGPKAKPDKDKIKAIFI